MSPDFATYSTALEQVCTEIIGPEASNVDQRGTFPERGLKALSAAGLMGAVSAPDIGGLGLGFRGAAAIVGRLAQECGSTAMVTCMHYCGTAVLEAFGPRDVRKAAASGTHLSDGKGFEIMMGTVLPMFNVLNAACSVGLMEAAVQRTAQHASGVRYAHLDSTLADLPTIRSYIARMRIRTDMARTLLDDTISAPPRSAGQTAMLRVLSCKAAAGEAATEVLDTAMRVRGRRLPARPVPSNGIFRTALTRPASWARLLMCCTTLWARRCAG